MSLQPLSDHDAYDWSLGTLPSGHVLGGEAPGMRVAVGLDFGERRPRGVRVVVAYDDKDILYFRSRRMEPALAELVGNLVLDNTLTPTDLKALGFKEE